jgi:hypothetical protein
MQFGRYASLLLAHFIAPAPGLENREDLLIFDSPTRISAQMSALAPSKLFVEQGEFGSLKVSITRLLLDGCPGTLLLYFFWPRYRVFSNFYLKLVPMLFQIPINESESRDSSFTPDALICDVKSNQGPIKCDSLPTFSKRCGACHYLDQT